MKALNILFVSIFLLVSCSTNNNQKQSGSFPNSNCSSNDESSPSQQETMLSISFYQLYFDEETKTYGNKRFDKKMNFERGYEFKLEDLRLNPIYVCSGDGYYTFGDFYFDENMTKRVTWPFVVLSDLDIYYHCVG